MPPTLDFAAGHTHSKMAATAVLEHKAQNGKRRTAESDPDQGKRGMEGTQLSGYSHLEFKVSRGAKPCMDSTSKNSRP